jgi:hypothetical protein
MRCHAFGNGIRRKREMRGNVEVVILMRRDISSCVCGDAKGEEIFHMKIRPTATIKMTMISERKRIETLEAISD